MTDIHPSRSNALQSPAQAKILVTLQDFASIAKSGKLSNLFLQSFAEVVTLKEASGEAWSVLRNLDVLIAILEKVKLNKANQLVLMQGIKIFINDFKTKKKAYKLLARIVERYELEGGIQELLQIHQEVTPLVEGRATKPRLRLIGAYISQVKNFVDTQEVTLDQVQSVLKQYIIELVSAMTNTNLKIRSLAESIFKDISHMMRVKFNAVNQLLGIILVGLAGNKYQT